MTADAATLPGAEHLPGLAAILAEVLGVPATEVQPTASLDDDLNCDALDRVEIAVILEQRHHITITDADEKGCATVADLLALLHRKTGRAQP